MEIEATVFSHEQFLLSRSFFFIFYFYFVICFHSVERVRALAMPNSGTQDFHLGDVGMVKLRSQKIKWKILRYHLRSFLTCTRVVTLRYALGYAFSFTRCSSLCVCTEREGRRCKILFWKICCCCWSVNEEKGMSRDLICHPLRLFHLTNVFLTKIHWRCGFFSL